MEHLHLFETQLNHDSLYEGDNYKEPWIAYTLDNASVTFNRPHDYSKDYFTIEALEDGNVYFKYLSFAPTANQRYIEYSKDNGETWTRTTNVDNKEVIMTIPLLTGEKAFVRGDNDSFGTYNEDGIFFGSCFYSDIKFNVSGNIMSLLRGENFINGTNVLEYEYTFLNLFYDSLGQYIDVVLAADCMVVNAKNLILPATELIDYCYYKMFYECTELTTAPELPATTLIDFCYSHMFSGCTSLTAAPVLPATILAYQCYYSMFRGCSSLTAAPELPAAVLTESCYSDMFAYCTALTTAPALPATSLAHECYSGMFTHCTLLNIAPKLPATTLTYSCYSGMFAECTALTTAPELPATTLAESCYSEMFRSCAALTATPELPATTLSNSCYSSMFWGCSSLTTAQALPATTLTERCYYRMFRGCKSLTTAPELPANVLAVECYRIMFTDCSQLNSITMLATNISATDCLTNWVNGVASTGTFIKAPSMTALSTGRSGIPSGWTVMDDTEYLTITALEDGEITITIPSCIDSTYATSLSYSKDKSNWTDTIVDDTDQNITISVSNGDNVYLMGDAIHWCNGDTEMGLNINSTSNINASGNIMSLLYGNNFKDKTSFPEGSNWTFGYLFGNNTHLISAEHLILPVTTLVPSCYSFMFADCYSLTTAPALPATTLADSCYGSMFESCTSLTTAPALPATTLADYCYHVMFSGTSLTTAPELPATTLAVGCYGNMLSGTPLTTAPELPATTLAEWCYYEMFAYCNSLTTAPTLTATTLANYCYYCMFRECSNLSNITMLATDISASGCLEYWVEHVSSTGTFIKAPSMTSLTTGFSGIPTGWTIMDDTEYLTISALEDGNITINIPSSLNSTYVTSISYSKDKSSWTETIVDDTDQTITIRVSEGENVYLKGIALQLCSDSGEGICINSTANINASDNIMSLLYGDNFKDKISFPEGSQFVFALLFNGNTNLINTENLILPVTTLAFYCYGGMFYGCTSLTNAPELPATTLAPYCYNGMFYGCTSFITASELRATTLDEGCYLDMFSDCSSLTAAPDLPATVLTESCYRSMFSGCTSLTTAPALPATTLASECYAAMFYGCTSLTTAPELPATILANNCYVSMFYDCSSLTTAPSLPATTLAESCYNSMFSGCTSLTAVPELHATTLAPSCYSSMFRGCTALTTAPKLPATTLATGCYSGMFYDCTSLTTAPELPAATLVSVCYSSMFWDCSKLNSITMLATNISASNCLSNWVSGVSATGTFVKAPSMTSLPSGDSGIPSGWTVLNDTEYLTISALGNGTITITIPSCIDSTYATSLSYSKDKSNWTETIVDNTEQTITISVSNGENVYLKGIAQQIYNFNSSDGIHINSSARIDASGNVMSILYGDNFKDKIAFSDDSQYALGGLFSGSTRLNNAKDLLLPATTLAQGCYYRMFSGCTLLTSTPSLHATTLADYCYSHMFDGCASLVTPPALPATTLKDYCYYHMFAGCASLTTAPTLPATTLAHSCYSGMFSGCNELITAPALPANTLATSCYSDMFFGCNMLTNAPELPATELAITSYDSMFRDCMSLRTAPELPATTLVSRCYCNMFYGCTWLTTVPELRATTLAEGCYQYMFSGCINLKSIAMFATDISASNCLYNWVVGVASTGVFVKAPSMTSLTTGASGIPSGWNVVDYLTLTALGDGEIKITIPYNLNSTYATSLSYSKDKLTWTDTIIDNTEQTISISVSNGDNVYLKGIARQLYNGNDGNKSNGVRINSTANINVSGNIMSLLYGDDFTEKTVFPAGSQYTFSYLFNSNTYLVNAENLILPVMELTYKCYSLMFWGCSSLITAPVLPATKLASDCYYFMFGKTSLINAPVLPATKLASGCYKFMFDNCTSLVTAPELPATALAENCYQDMFRGCSSLKIAPALPATELTNTCYRELFRLCTSLVAAPELPATTLSTECYRGMFFGCSSLENAPVLNATILTTSCYQYMLYDCKKINSITMLATDISASSCLANWVSGVSATGTFTKSSSASIPSGVSGIPSGWTVMNK